MKEKKTLQPAELSIIDITISDIGHNGDGVGKYRGIAVFVPDTLPGEQARVTITAKHTNFWRGQLVNIVTESPDRVAPPCTVSRECGGCQLQHWNYGAQLAWKTRRVTEALARIGHNALNVQPCIGSDAPFFYRNKVLLPLGSVDGVVVAGFFSAGTHHLIPITTCHIQDNRFEPIINATLEFANRYQLSVYNESTHSGLLRGILLRASDTHLVVALIINGRQLPHSNRWLDTLASFKMITGVGVIINTDKTNVPITDNYINLEGDSTLTHSIDTRSFLVNATGFFQVNSGQIDRLVAVIKSMLTDHYRVVFDLYCGVGTLGLSIADSCDRLYGNEWSPQAINVAKQNAMHNGIAHAHFESGDAAAVTTQWLRNGVVPDAIILDPPRKGCSTEMIEALKDANATQLIYVSCDPGTLARDIHRLAPHYRVHYVQPVDMFPHTAHVETVVHLRRIPLQVPTELD